MRRLAVIIWLLAYCPQVSAMWEGKQDNKTVDELELMNDHELASEAVDVCNRGAAIMKSYGTSSDPSVRLVGYRKRDEANDYLKTMERILRKKRNGPPPYWIFLTQMGVRDGDSKRCTQALMESLDEKP